MIFKIEVYADEFNRVVTTKTDQESKSVAYTGSVVVKTEQGTLPIEFPFGDSIESVEQAFDEFDETLKAFVQARQEAEAARQAEATPPASEPPA